VKGLIPVSRHTAAWRFRVLSCCVGMRVLESTWFLILALCFYRSLWILETCREAETDRLMGSLNLGSNKCYYKPGESGQHLGWSLVFTQRKPSW
jgi:hypothetical protein